VAVMHNGRLLQVGSGQELLRAPADPYVEQILRAPLEQARAVTALFHEEGQGESQAARSGGGTS